MDRAGNEFLSGIPAANAHAAEFEMRAFFQSHFQLKPGKGGRSIESKMLIASALLYPHAQSRNAGFAKLAHFADCLAFRDNSLAPNAQRSRIGLRQPIAI